MPKRNPPVEAQDGQPEAAPAAAPPEPRRTKGAYAVYLVIEMDDDGVASELRLLDVVTAEDAAAARWAAVDGDPDLQVDGDEDLQARARADADGPPPMLLALAARFAKPVATREEQIVQTKRR